MQRCNLSLAMSFVHTYAYQKADMMGGASGRERVENQRKR